MPRRLAALMLAAALVLAAALAAGPAAAATAGADNAPPLPALGIDGTAVSVSGISSGGFMAEQLQVTFSATIIGVGIVAAGPYGCAGGGYPWNLWWSTNVCAILDDGLPFAGPPPLARSLDAVRRNAAAGTIDDPANLSRIRAYLFSGSLDRTVPPSVMAVTDGFMRTFVADPDQRIAMITTVPAAHSMVTHDFGNACDVSASPYLSDCDYDAAGALLAHIHGHLAPPVVASGHLIPFDQRAFFGGKSDTGLADIGYIYVPAACEAPDSHCRLHVALHGCEQSALQIGETFVRHAGYNGWAEANHIVVLYPQAAPLTTSLLGVTLPWPNPKACWDWWGFTGPDYADRNGVQPKAIKAMIDRLAAH
jgi:hypothetical protein